MSQSIAKLDTEIAEMKAALVAKKERALHAELKALKVRELNHVKEMIAKKHEQRAVKLSNDYCCLDSNNPLTWDIAEQLSHIPEGIRNRVMEQVFAQWA